MKKLLVAAFMSVAASASAQVDTVKAKQPLKYSVDSTLSATLDSMVANKAKTVYRLTPDSILHFMSYPQNRGIGFMQFRDRNGDGVFAMDEMTYAEYSDGFGCTVVSDTTGDGTLSIIRQDTARATIKTESEYKDAAVAHRKNPPPVVEGAEATRDWIVARLSRKGGIAR